MAPRPTVEILPHIPIWKHCWFWFHAIAIVTGYIMIMLLIATFRLISGIHIDPACWDMDRMIATGKIKGKSKWQ